MGGKGGHLRRTQQRSVVRFEDELENKSEMEIRAAKDVIASEMEEIKKKIQKLNSELGVKGKQLYQLNVMITQFNKIEKRKFLKELNWRFLLIAKRDIPSDVYQKMYDEAAQDAREEKEGADY